MDFQNDVVSTRLVFSATPESDHTDVQHKIIRMNDAKTDFGELFEPENCTWMSFGMKVFKFRWSASTSFDNGRKVLRHAALMSNALREELRLNKIPECIEAILLYGELNVTLRDMDINQVGPINVTVERGMPSSWVKTDSVSTFFYERLLSRFYGGNHFECMTSQYQHWDVIEVAHPLEGRMGAYPLIFCDPRVAEEGAWTSQGCRPEQRWLCLAEQQPCEVLIRRVASSDEGAHICGPLVSSNITGDLQEVPGARMSLKFVVWRR